MVLVFLLGMSVNKVSFKIKIFIVKKLFVVISEVVCVCLCVFISVDFLGLSEGRKKLKDIIKFLV